LRPPIQPKKRKQSRRLKQSKQSKQSHNVSNVHQKHSTVRIHAEFTELCAPPPMILSESFVTRLAEIMHEEGWYEKDDMPPDAAPVDAVPVDAMPADNEDTASVASGSPSESNVSIQSWPASTRSAESSGGSGGSSAAHSDANTSESGPDTQYAPIPIQIHYGGYNCMLTLEYTDIPILQVHPNPDPSMEVWVTLMYHAIPGVREQHPDYSTFIQRARQDLAQVFPEYVKKLKDLGGDANPAIKHAFEKHLRRIFRDPDTFYYLCPDTLDEFVDENFRSYKNRLMSNKLDLQSMQWLSWKWFGAVYDVAYQVEQDDFLTAYIPNPLHAWNPIDMGVHDYPIVLYSPIAGNRSIRLYRWTQNDRYQIARLWNQAYLNSMQISFTTMICAPDDMPTRRDRPWDPPEIPHDMLFPPVSPPSSRSSSSGEENDNDDNDSNISAASTASIARTNVSGIPEGFNHGDEDGLIEENDDEDLLEWMV
jgi:hypothetical protein